MNPVAGFPDLPNWDRLKEIMDAADRVSRLFEHSNLARISHLWDQQPISSAMLDAQKIFERQNSFFKHLSESNIGFSGKLDHLASTYGRISSLVDPSFLRSADNIAAYFERLNNNPTLTNVMAELERVRPILERYERDIEEAADEDAASLSLREGLQAAVEAVTGANFRVQSGADRLKLYIVLIGFVLSLLINYAQSQNDRTQSRDIATLRAVQESQSQTIMAVGEAIREIQENTIGIEALPLVEFSRRSILRLLPDGQSGRIAEVGRGKQARVVMVNGRWLFVELIDKGQRTNILGWVYRRNIRFLPSLK